jgi:hypothetical protein
MTSGKLSETHGMKTTSLKELKSVKERSVNAKFEKSNSILSSITSKFVGKITKGGKAVSSILKNKLKSPVLGGLVSSKSSEIVKQLIEGDVKNEKRSNLVNNVITNNPTNYSVVTPSKPIGEKTYVAPVAASEVKAQSPTVPTVQNINLNVSGTIRLDGGNGVASSINFDDLIKDPAFVRKIKDMIVKSMSETENGGKQNLEGDRSNRRR